MTINKTWRNRDRRRLNGVEGLEDRRVLSGDGITLGPFLSGLPEAHERVDELAAEISANLATATLVDLDMPTVQADFDSVDDVDVFKITTPSLSEDAVGNGLLYINSFAFSTGAPSMVVIADADGTATHAGLSLFQGLSVQPPVEVEPETTYYFAVGQVGELEAFPLTSDVVGPYQVDLGYVEPRPQVSAPVDVEPDTPAEAIDISDFGLTPGYLNAGGDVDYFQFTTSDAGTLYVGMEGQTIAELRIEDADGNALGRELSTFTPVEIGLDVGANETYLISVRGDELEGSYTLLATNASDTPVDVPPAIDRHADAIDLATDIPDFGGIGFESGIVNGQDDVDWFRKVAPEGTATAVQFRPNELVQADVVSVGGEVLNTFVYGDADFFLIEQDEFYLRVSIGEEFAAEDVEAFYDFMVIERAGAFGGDPTFGASDPSEDRGGDSPGNREDLEGNSIERAQPLENALALGIDGFQYAAGALNGFNDLGELDVDYFSMNLPEGIATIEVAATTGGLDPVPQYAVISPEGEVIAESWFGEAIDVAIPEGGDYFLRIGSTSEALVDYEIAVVTVTGSNVADAPVTDPADPELDELSLEQLAALLGLDVEALLSEGTSVDTEESGETPTMSWDELAVILGIDPDLGPEAVESDTLAEAFDRAAYDQIMADLWAGYPVADVDVRMGDINLDNSVNFDDFLIMTRYFGTTEGAEWQHGNFDGDGDVDFADFLALSGEFDES